MPAEGYKHALEKLSHLRGREEAS